jgi:hypothetical protein
VNIAPEDILAGSLKLILGLIWQLVLHYQIAGNGTGDSIKGRDELLKWINQSISPLVVTDFKKRFPFEIEASKLKKNAFVSQLCGWSGFLCSP